MLPAPRSCQYTRKEQMSINIVSAVPSSLDSHSTCLPCLFGDNDGSCVASRLLTDDVQNEENDDEAETAIMGEVADWLQSGHTDEFWVPRCKQTRKALPTTSQLATQLKSPNVLTSASCGAAEIFELLLEAIAVQLLASCYTSLPPSSAVHLPLIQQRREAESVTALRLHSHQRFEPAAGHHARAPSEATPWPGLYAGPGLEAVLAEKVSRNRQAKRGTAYSPRFAASGWTDGTSPSGAGHFRDESHSSADSSSSSEPNFLSKLICQTSTPKHPRRKYNTLFISRLSPRRRRHKSHSTPSNIPSKPTRNLTKPLQSLKSEAVQRIPSALRLRHTQSAPRFTVREATRNEHVNTSRRHSSNPSIGSPLTYQYDLPEIRRISATTAASQTKRSISHSLRACGRGDMIFTQEPVEADSSMSYEPPQRKPSSHLVVPPLFDEELSPTAISPCSKDITSSQRPPARRSSSPQSSRPCWESPPSDYFKSVSTATCVDDDKYHESSAEDDPTTESEDTGSGIERRPTLQQIFARMDAWEDENSSDSDMERYRKRQSIMVHQEDTD
ncbi:hypothetical protein FB567DRAFT_553473 [Paraphoma chrysanthemicola]|uniref:Uncharacterized protein n=1 Tax=Paraphoma chrysanthemicola TaxID=798071 RepID=A0A8K0QYT2_9PLEO|nr:hypothetical protein FB567DRAFT_553473 [Paraphoma chrysanthemicola]